MVVGIPGPTLGWWNPLKRSLNRKTHLPVPCVVFGCFKLGSASFKLPWCPFYQVWELSPVLETPKRPETHLIDHEQSMVEAWKQQYFDSDRVSSYQTHVTEKAEASDGSALEKAWLMTLSGIPQMTSSLWTDTLQAPMDQSMDLYICSRTIFSQGTTPPSNCLLKCVQSPSQRPFFWVYRAHCHCRPAWHLFKHPYNCPTGKFDLILPRNTTRSGFQDQVLLQDTR